MKKFDKKIALYQGIERKYFNSTVKLPLMPQPFEVNVDKNKIMNQEIILVDDVYTTGRTMFYAAECLLPYQPKKIRTFTLAR